jgi:hypothetical protein
MIEAPTHPSGPARPDRATQVSQTGLSRRRFLAAGATTLTTAALGAGGWLGAASR